ncbi:putative transposase [Orientia tsutsugamushi str. Gilliam]|uniref:Putative transposase n=1 Tax=Orientia tsutsugamushi str. Gilliam TaxID=1359184 RepID=A0A0F3M623_ORITS|nr:putative transposase [Orientia tsutsugamushi str. Gilliam]
MYTFYSLLFIFPLILNWRYKTSKSKKEERLEFQDKIKRYKDKGKVIVFTYERGFVHSTPRTVICSKIHGMLLRLWHPSKRTNVIEALVDKSLLTVFIFDCNVNTAIFNCWIE